MSRAAGNAECRSQRDVFCPSSVLGNAPAHGTICREEPVLAGKVICGVRNETSGQSWPSNTVATDPLTSLISQLVHPFSCRLENSTFDLVYKVCNCDVHMYRHSGRVAQRHHIAVDEIDLSLPATLEVLEHGGFDVSVESNHSVGPRLVVFLCGEIARPSWRNRVHG